MNYAQINQRYFCGVDLHVNSMYMKILDREGQVLYKRNMPNNMALFKKNLTPFLTTKYIHVVPFGKYLNRYCSE